VSKGLPFFLGPITPIIESARNRRESDRTLRDGSFEVALSRHFVPGYDRTVPPGLGAKPPSGNKSSQTFLNLVPFNPGLSSPGPLGQRHGPNSLSKAARVNLQRGHPLDTF
jgi:hypothetical protein